MVTLAVVPPGLATPRSRKIPAVCWCAAWVANCGVEKLSNRRVPCMVRRVVKTTLWGEVIFTIGHPLTIGVYEPGWEYRPTEKLDAR